MPVGVFPNGVFGLARAFAARPQASKMSSRFRWRNLSHAMIVDGPEMTNTRPARAK